MLKYFFDVRINNTTLLDSDGRCLPSGCAARDEARRDAIDIAIECLRGNSPDVPDAILVRDQAGRILSAVEIRQAVIDALENASAY